MTSLFFFYTAFISIHTLISCQDVELELEVVLNTFLGFNSLDFGEVYMNSETEFTEVSVEIPEVEAPVLTVPEIKMQIARQQSVALFQLANMLGYAFCKGKYGCPITTERSAPVPDDDDDNSALLFTIPGTDQQLPVPNPIGVAGALISEIPVVGSAVAPILDPINSAIGSVTAPIVNPVLEVTKPFLDIVTEPVQAITKPIEDFFTGLFKLSETGQCQDLADYKWNNTIFSQIEVQEQGEDIWLKMNCDAGTDSFKGLTIKLSNWAFNMQPIKFGGISQPERYLIRVDHTQFNNDGDIPVKSTPEISKKVDTIVNKYDLNTFKWQIGKQQTIDGSLKVFDVGVGLHFQTSETEGNDHQTGSVQVTGDSVTLSASAEVEVPPHTTQNFDIFIYGLKVDVDSSELTIQASFSVEIDGYLRRTGGLGVDESNYHRTFRTSEALPNYVSKFGSKDIPFYEDLLKQSQDPKGGSDWDWKAILEKYQDNLPIIVGRLVDQSYYTNKETFRLEAIKGTDLVVNIADQESLN